jgi:hypothetical protein
MSDRDINAKISSWTGWIIKPRKLFDRVTG